MKIIRDLLNDEFKVPERLIVTVGAFDGVHLGHQQVISRVVDWARELSRARREGTVASGLVTFDPLPRQVLYSESVPGLLTTIEQKLDLVASLGIEIGFVLRFDKAFAETAADDFVRDVLVEKLRIEGIVVGHDWQFGAGGGGDYDRMMELGNQYGFDVRQVEPVDVNGTAVSSSIIRRKILADDLEGACGLLGHRYSLAGRVKKGVGVGRDLGFPTANIESHGGLVPPGGIYAALVRIDSEQLPAAVFIGNRPAGRETQEQTVEAHILDFDGELYDRELELVFVNKLREGKRFADRESLITQIEDDVKRTRDVLSDMSGTAQRSGMCR